jgi:polar amino acid transport system substrate-binding protein
MLLVSMQILLAEFPFSKGQPVSGTTALNHKSGAVKPSRFSKPAEDKSGGGWLLKKAFCALVVLMIAAAIAVPARSQTAVSSIAPMQGENADVRAVAILAPPAVMEQNGTLSGFSIELWNAIAAQLKLKTSYQIMPDLGAVEDALRSKRADVIVSPVFVTSALEEVFDFSLPVMNAGLQIMVLDTGQKVHARGPLLDMLRLMFSRTTVLWLGMALLLVLIPAHLVWLFERRQQTGAILSRRYFPGIFQAIFWAISTLTSQSSEMPHQWVARTFAIFWMFAGVIFVAFYTAQLTTTLTVEQIRGAIEGPGDLPGKRVATLAQSPAADYLREQNVQVQDFPAIDQLFKVLLNKKVDAVVVSAPVLRYYAAHEGRGQVKVVGPEFETSPVAFVVQMDSPLRRRIDVAMAKLRENGTYRQLYDKWFGSP